MTHKSTWKCCERAVAKFFRTKRTPLSGSNSGHDTNSDTLHKKLYIEVKYRQRMAVVQLYRDTAVKAKNEKKIPVVAIKEKGKKGFLLVIDPKHLAKVAEFIV